VLNEVKQTGENLADEGRATVTEQAALCDADATEPSEGFFLIGSRSS
jgi:hypothetical protein